MVHICDAIMGSGKSTATINYMNAHPDEKFLYITPYLDEAARIKKACRSLHFAEPEFLKGSKLNDTLRLLREGRNIATTHQAFKMYTPEFLDHIRDKGYTIFIDESISMLDVADISVDDFRILAKCGYVEVGDGDVYRRTGKEYAGGVYQDFLKVMERNGIIYEEEDYTIRALYWIIPAELIMASQNVFVLTYLFDYQNTRYYFDMNGIEYDRVGISVDEKGLFQFDERGTYVPEYTKYLKDKIHILDHPKMNAIGDKPTALSMRWFNRCGKDEKEELKRHVGNFFKNITDGPAESRMWSTYKGQFEKLKGKGYTKGFLPFNSRATNDFRDRTNLAYCVNLYMNVGEKLLYERRGIEPNDDGYALSTMVQWVWRSAIRDGKDINLYIPSRRMRELLTGWIDSVSGGGVNG